MGRRKHGAALGNERFRKKKVETETESKESRSKGKRTYVEKKEIKPDHAIQVPSDGGSGGGGRTRQKARSILLTFCLSE